jgi:hypothetical protein
MSRAGAKLAPRTDTARPIDLDLAARQKNALAAVARLLWKLADRRVRGVGRRTVAPDKDQP